MRTQWLSGKYNVPGAIVSKEVRGDTLLEYERAYDFIEENLQQWTELFIANSLGKYLTLFIEWPA